MIPVAEDFENSYLNYSDLATDLCFIFKEHNVKEGVIVDFNLKLHDEEGLLNDPTHFIFKLWEIAGSEDFARKFGFELKFYATELNE